MNMLVMGHREKGEKKNTANMNLELRGKNIKKVSNLNEVNLLQIDYDEFKNEDKGTHWYSINNQIIIKKIKVWKLFKNQYFYETYE